MNDFIWAWDVLVQIYGGIQILFMYYTFSAFYIELKYSCIQISERGRRLVT